MKRFLVVFVGVIFLVGCNQNLELNDYENNSEITLNQTDFTTPSNYNVETSYDVKNNSFYVIIDDPVGELKDFQSLAVPVFENELVGSMPQVGYFEDGITLGVTQKGVILSGEITEDVSGFEIILNVKYELNNKMYDDFILISDIVLIE